MKTIIKKTACLMAGMLMMLEVHAQYGYALSWRKYQEPAGSYPYEADRSKSHLWKRTFFNADWQVNGTIGNDFVESTSGWGAHFEAGCYLTEHWAAGAFVAFHTNNEYFPRESFIWNGAALSTDQQHSLYQLPFGVSARYRFFDGIFAPYASLKLGAQYAETESYWGEVCSYNEQWGFYLSPEVGVEIHPFRKQRLGFHVAVYYSYATNDNTVMWYDADGLNNYGLRLGVSF